MTVILSLVLFVVFFLLGAIHFYWVMGGEWGLKKAIPTKSKEEEPAKPPMIATVIVGLGLLSFGLLYLFRSGLVRGDIPDWCFMYGGWAIPALFLVRSIGEFKYVGFFKRVRDTEFARADSKIFSPLCLIIGVMGLLVQLV